MIERRGILEGAVAGIQTDDVEGLVTCHQIVAGRHDITRMISSKRQSIEQACGQAFGDMRTHKGAHTSSVHSVWTLCAPQPAHIAVNGHPKRCIGAKVGRGECECLRPRSRRALPNSVCVRCVCNQTVHVRMMMPPVPWEILHRHCG